VDILFDVLAVGNKKRGSLTS